MAKNAQEFRDAVASFVCGKHPRELLRRDREYARSGRKYVFALREEIKANRIRRMFVLKDVRDSTVRRRDVFENNCITQSICIIQKNSGSGCQIRSWNIGSILYRTTAKR